jgi:hypothetical protein
VPKEYSHSVGRAEGERRESDVEDCEKIRKKMPEIDRFNKSSTYFIDG